MNNKVVEEGTAWFDIAMHNNLMRLAIKRVIVSNHHTIVLWNDNTKTIVTCREDDEDNYSIETAVMAAFLKKILGAHAFHKKLENGLNRVVVQDQFIKVKKPVTRDSKGKFVKKKTTKTN